MFEITNTLMGPLDSLFAIIFVALVSYCVIAIVGSIFETFSKKQDDQNESK